MKRLIPSKGFILSAVLVGLSASVFSAETTPPQPVIMGTCNNFLVLSGAGIQNNSGPSLIFNGNIGTSPSPGSAITGIVKPQVTGNIYTVDNTGPAASTTDATGLSTAKGDITAAYNDAFGRVLARVTQAPELGGLTLAPGLYWSATGFTISTGNLMLDAGGNTAGVWIFQAGTAGSPTDVSLNTTRTINLANSASAANVFWVCRTGILGTSTTFRGNIIADQAVTNAGSSIFEGRQLAFTSGITFNGVANSSMGVPGATPIPTATMTPTVQPNVPGATYIYPSPATGDFANVVYKMASSGNAKIRFFNETGRLVDTIEEKKSSGWQSSVVSVGKFASGVYVYIVDIKYDDNSSESQPKKKFVVLH